MTRSLRRSLHPSISLLVAPAPKPPPSPRFSFVVPAVVGLAPRQAGRRVSTGRPVLVSGACFHPTGLPMAYVWELRFLLPPSQAPLPWRAKGRSNGFQGTSGTAQPTCTQHSSVHSIVMPTFVHNNITPLTLTAAQRPPTCAYREERHLNHHSTCTRRWGHLVPAIDHVGFVTRSRWFPVDLSSLIPVVYKLKILSISASRRPIVLAS